MIQRKRYAVAFLHNDTLDEVETEVEVWGADRVRAEQQARRAGLRSLVIDTKSQQATDLGDMEAMTALEVWAALVRTKQYGGDSTVFRLEHYIDAQRLDQDGDQPDPTQPAASTGAGS